MAARTKTIHYAWGTDTTETKHYIEKCFIYDDSTTTYYDETTDVNDSGASDITYLTDENDCWYFGASTQFDNMYMDMSSNGTGYDGNEIWEYWDGDSWEELTNLTATQAETAARRDCEFRWPPPDDWATTSVNGETLYWIRHRMTGSWTLAPVGNEVEIATGNYFASKTIYIPETSNRTIKSAAVRVNWHTKELAQNISTVHVRMKVGSTWTLLGDDTSSRMAMNQTGENVTDYVEYDCTDALNDNFGAGASQDIELATFLQYTVTAGGTTNSSQNMTATLWITYEADEQDTRIKTVMIPLNSPTGDLSTSSTEIGTNQVPDLDDLLPEASKSYRDIFFVVQGNNFASNATDYVLSLELDSEGESAFGTMDNGGKSGTFDRYIWSRTDMSTSDAHAFKAKTSTSDVPYTSLAIYLVVTYEYGESSSSSFFNSIQFGFEHSNDYMPTSSDNADYLDAEIYIEEPATITLQQSGIMTLSRGVSSSGTISIKESSAESYTTYGDFNTAWCGQDAIIHRIDDDLSISRGLNTIAINNYCSTAVRWKGQQTMCFLNYTSGKASGGSNTHNHTTLWVLKDYYANDTDPTVSDFAPDIVETSYWLNNCTLSMKSRTDYAGFSPAIYCHLNAGEWKGAGWFEMASINSYGQAESGQVETYFNITKKIERYPASPRDRINLETTRDYRISSVDALYATVEMWVTYHTITFTTSGTVSGYDGDGSDITVELHRTDTHDRMIEATTAAGGGYTATWYDDTIDLYAHAEEDETHTGRSAEGKAS